MTTLCVGDSHVRRLERFIDALQPSSVTYGIANLEQVDYYGISGGLVSNNRHLCILTDAVRRYRPRHIIVFIGGNDLDSKDANFDVECLVTRLVAFLTQLERKFHLHSVSVLSLVPRKICRNISADIYNQRVSEANNLLRQNCVHLKITYWKLRGFTTSQKNIYCDGVHFNCLGLYKLMRQIRGIFLTRPRDIY